jgi:hypothetical protein
MFPASPVRLVVIIVGLLTSAGAHPLSAQRLTRGTLQDSLATARDVAFSRAVLATRAVAPVRQSAGTKNTVTVLQVVVGAGAALLGGLGGLGLLRDIGTQRVSGDAGYSYAGQAGWMVGSMLSGAAAVVLLGKVSAIDGSSLGAFGGATIATLPQLLLLDEGWLPLMATVYGGGVLQSGFATAGYYLGR